MSLGSLVCPCLPFVILSLRSLGGGGGGDSSVSAVQDNNIIIIQWLLLMVGVFHVLVVVVRPGDYSVYVVCVCNFVIVWVSVCVVTTGGVDDEEE